MNRNHRSRQTGFTILELMLAMTFLAFVLVFSATVIVQMTQTYMKGLSIKQINQAGRTITDDLARSLESSASTEINTTRIDSGILCVGTHAYIWNPVYDQSGNFNTNLNRYTLNGEPITLARVASSAVGDCAGSFSNAIPATLDNVSLLSGRSRVLTASATPSTIDRKLVNVKFVLGTYDSSENAALSAKDFDNVTGSAYFDENLGVSGQFTCRPDRLGNFCAFADFATTVYVTR